jgi:hypothetical protein
LDLFFEDDDGWAFGHMLGRCKGCARGPVQVGADEARGLCGAGRLDHS